MLRVDPEGILAIIFIFGGGTLFLLAVSPVGKALADRIRHGNRQLGPGTEPEVLQELDHLRQDVTELQERLDFAERLLAQKQPAAGLGAGEDSR
ncbi:MAG: hypothetical protein HOP28_18140 [Gemmatimonadales bacterium]|nr:hypothetical protein [Gemmatimonadales bacterium]